MAELVIGSTFPGIAEDFIGLFAFLEIFLGVLVVRVAVRVVFLRCTPVGLLQFSLTGVLRYAQHFIVIAF